MNDSSLKFLHIADSHFGAHFAIKPRNKLRREYGESFFKVSEYIIEQAIKEEVDFILHVGDFFNRSKPPSEVIDQAINSFLPAIKQNIPIYLIPGNHERSKITLGLLTYMNKIHVFQEPCSFIFKKNRVRVKICGFPYIRHHAKRKFIPIVKKAWENTINNKERQKNNFQILALHQLIEGSRIEHYTFRRGHNVILFEDIPNIFNYIACGHVHRFQFLYYERNASIKSSNVNYSVFQQLKDKKWKFVNVNQNYNSHDDPVICYPGSLERVSMAERNEPKGYVIGNLNFSQSSGQINSASYTFHEINALPLIFETLDVSSNSIEEHLNRILNHMKEFSKRRQESSLKAIYRLKIVGNITEISYEINFIKEKAKELGIYLTIYFPTFFKKDS